MVDLVWGDHKRRLPLIKINKDDGKTLSFDLSNTEECEKVSSLLEGNDFLKAMTGIGCLHRTYWHQLTSPKKFHNVRYNVEKVIQEKNGVTKEVGEKIICQADDIQLTIMVYYNVRPKMTRIELKKIGKQRFIPGGNHNGVSKDN